MRLYFKRGACSLASRIVLIELGHPFEAIRVDTDAGLTEHGLDYRTVNPRGYVPALEIDGAQIITENPAILQFLADLDPGAALAPPNGGLERVQLQETLNFISSELHKAFSPYFNSAPLSDDAANAASAELSRRIGDVEHSLSDGRPFILGQTMTVADAYLFVVLNWAGFIGFDINAWVRVAAYVERMARRPSVRAALVQEGLLKEPA